MTDYLYYKDSSFALYKGKMEEVLQTLPPNSVDCIITDSPYHLKSISERYGKSTTTECKYNNDGLFIDYPKALWDKLGTVEMYPSKKKHGNTAFPF